MENICALAASNLRSSRRRPRLSARGTGRKRKMRYFSSHLLFDVDVETCCMPVKKAPEKKAESHWPANSLPKRVFPHSFYLLRTSWGVRDILGELTNESLMTFQSLHQSSSRQTARTKLILNVRYVKRMIPTLTRQSKVNGINGLRNMNTLRMITINRKAPWLYK